jgi:hypothetical protein
MVEHTTTRRLATLVGTVLALTYKDGTGATIGNPVELRATTDCVTFG